MRLLLSTMDQITNRKKFRLEDSCRLIPVGFTIDRITNRKKFRLEDSCQLIPVNSLANTAHTPTDMISTMLGSEYSPKICRN